MTIFEIFFDPCQESCPGLDRPGSWRILEIVSAGITVSTEEGHGFGSDLLWSQRDQEGGIRRIEFGQLLA